MVLKRSVYAISFYMKLGYFEHFGNFYKILTHILSWILIKIWDMLFFFIKFGIYITLYEEHSAFT